MIHKTSQQNWPHAILAMAQLRVMTAFVVSLFLCLSLSLPAMGAQGSMIEICGEQGPELVQIVSESDFGAPASECAHCSSCLFNGPDSKALFADDGNSLRAIAITPAFLSAAIFAQPIQRMGGVLSRGPPSQGLELMNSLSKRSISCAGSVAL